MKKKDIFRITITTYCFLSMLGCNKAPVSETIFKSIQIAEQVPLMPDTLSPACNINIDFNYAVSEDSVAYYINREIVKAAFGYEALSPEVAVDSFVAHYTHNYIHDLLPYYKEDKESGKEGLGWYNYYYHLKTDMQKGKEGVLNSKERKELIKFFQSSDPDEVFGTNWDVLLYEWNKNNNRKRISRDTEMPNYLLLK